MTTRRSTQRLGFGNTLNKSNTSNILAAKNNKRQADQTEEGLPKKRTAFVDLTNAVGKGNQDGKKNAKPPAAKKTGKRKGKYSVAIPTVIEAPTSSQPEKTETTWEIIELSQSQESQVTSSQESNVSSSQDTHKSSQSSNASVVDDADLDSQISLLNLRNEQESGVKVEQDWEDIDAENSEDPNQAGPYAYDIFQYYKEREVKFSIPDYMAHLQKDLSNQMRAILVDWLVEVQENFELNHETLYLAVKMVDLYLSHKTITREKLQLIGATALFIASKYDERCPPVLDDFLYICDDAYQRREFIKMEIEMLKTLGHDIGMPLSYRFLRRFSKCKRSEIEILTLARYILEFSLTDYPLVREPDSKIAAAALLLACMMKGNNEWNGTMRHYTGYTIHDLSGLVTKLNNLISSPPNKNLNTIRSKYSHKVFHEVALTPPLTPEVLKEISVVCL